MIRGDRLKSLRKTKKLTQTELGQMIGVKKPTISSWEKSNRNPSFEHLVALCCIFAVKADYLIGQDIQVTIEDDIERTRTLSKEELMFLDELRQDKFIYDVLLEDPKRMANLIKNKIG